MCLDINSGDYTSLDDGLLEYYLKKKFIKMSDNSYHKHKLKMLPSFHISLEAPKTKFDLNDLPIPPLDWLTTRAIIGAIVLANIHISQKNNKKSAWIPLHPDLLDEVMPHRHNDWNYDRTDDPDAFNHMLLHISLANLTGNPHDSIARPEDCIIDTINN